MIDTHCHLTFAQLHERVEEVIGAAGEAGVDRLITVGTTRQDADVARAVAEQHDNVYFTAGIHPHYPAQTAAGDIYRLPAATAHDRCVAYGEMGLDWHYDDPPRELQRELFRAQLAAVEGDRNTDRPIIIHCRKAVDDTLAMMRQFNIAGERFVFHCFTEDAEDCRKVLDYGCMVSFTGIVTYKNAPEVRASARLVPADRIMIETDAPYLSPEPHRKVRPNEPKFVVDTAKCLADLRGVSFADFVEQCDANAERFFNLPAATG
ncbi:MAG: YchF/TatD family DNA exonuclease [Alphaproteobacteria bacterium]|jgi:TatD DNase family protein|nr:YchF/TatD family DNA exonuclease [Alphaproteobacteria bacterium]